MDTTQLVLCIVSSMLIASPLYVYSVYWGERRERVYSVERGERGESVESGESVYSVCSVYSVV